MKLTTEDAHEMFDHALVILNTITNDYGLFKAIIGLLAMDKFLRHENISDYYPPYLNDISIERIKNE